MKSKKRFNVLLAVFIGVFCAFVSFGCAKNKKGPITPEEPPSPQPTQYTVTYRYNYEGAPDNGVFATRSVTENTVATKPSPDPTREEYVFTGWYVDSACLTEYDFSALITAAKDLYAGWEEQETPPAPPTKYAVTVNPATFGTVTVDKTQAEAGETVTVTATPASGYELNTLVYNDGSDHDIKATKQFAMPEKAVTVTATFALTQVTPPAPPTKYAVTVNSATFGTVTVDKTQAEAGETVTVTVIPASGYELNTLVYNDGSDHDIKATKQFAMPEKAVTVTATFALIQVTPPTKYAVTVNPATFGTVTVDKTQAEAGETVTVTTTPASGYELSTLVYNDGSDHDIKATKRFTMPERAVTVTATFAPEQVSPDPAYAVTYHYNYTGAPNNGVYTTQNVTENTAATKPAVDPTRTGYTFTKWYIDAACNTEYDFSTLVTAAKDLYAGWNRNAPVLTGITVTPPTKTQYVVNQAFNPSGLNVTAQFDYGDDETLSKGDGNNGYSYVTPVLDAVGTKTVTVSYKGMTDTFTLTVIAREMTSLSISGALASPSQYIGETLSTAGLTFTANYNDGQKETIAASAITFTSTGKLDATNKFTALGAATITASYGGRSATFGVTVIEHAVTKLEIGGTLNKTEYQKDETFSPAGLTFTATLDNDETVNVAAGDVLFTAPSLSNGKLTSYGAIQITASYKGVASATKINVTVNAPDTLEVGAWYLLGTFNEWGAAASTTQYKLTYSTATRESDGVRVDTYVITNVKLSVNDEFKVAKYAGKNGTENTFADYKNNSAVSVDPSSSILSLSIIDSGSDYGNIKVNAIDASVANSGWNFTITEYYDKTPHWVAVNIKLFGFVDWRDPATGAHSDNISASNPQAGDIELRGNFTDNFASSDKWSSRNTDIVTKIGNVYYFENVYLKAHDSFKVVKVGDPDTWLGTNDAFAVGGTLDLTDWNANHDGDAPNIYLGAIADGLYNIVIDAAYDTIAIYEAETLAVEFKANVKIKKGETPKKADLTVTYGGAAVGDDYVLNAEAATRGDNSITVIYNGAVAELHYTAYGEFSVTFNKNTNYNPVGMPTDIPAVLENTKLDEPTAPTLKGFIFGGWYKDNACTQVWNFDTDTVSAQRTLYAKWEARSFDVVYSVDGNATRPSNPATYTATGGEFVNITLNDPSMDYYAFDGWYTALTGGDKVTEIGYALIPEIGNTITLYAKFNARVYLIRFECAQTQDYALTMPSQMTFRYGDEAVSVPDATVNKHEYRFVKWYFKGDEDKTAVTTIDPAFVVSHGLTNGGDITLVAEVERKAEYTFTFDLNYIGAPEADTATVLDRDKVGEPIEPKRRGYEFKGWYNDANCTSEYDFDTVVTANDEVYAKWEIVEFDVVYELPNGVTNAAGNPTKFTVESQDFTLIAPTVDKTGYYFVGWSVAKGGLYEQIAVLTADVIDDYIAFTSKQIKLLADIADIYSVRFDKNAGDDDVLSMPADRNEHYGNKLTAIATEPARDGYVFMGWYKEAACEHAWSFETDTVNGDVTLYAKWELNVVTEIAVTSAPTKVNYFAGDELELDGLVVTLTYLDGTNKVVSGTDEDIANYVTFSAVPSVGDTEEPSLELVSAITVTAKDTTVSKSFGITVYNKATSIVITPPNKTRYEDESETLVLTGMKVTVYYNNGTTIFETISRGFSTNPESGKAVGNITQLSVTYVQDLTGTGLENQSLKATTPIEVKAKEVASISVKTPPTKTEYFIGDTVDLAGLVLTVTYDIGDPREVAYSEVNAANFTVKYKNGGNALVDGETSYTVVYGGKEVDINIPRPNAFVVSFVENILYDTKNGVIENSMPGNETIAVYNSELTVDNPRRRNNAYRFDGWFTDSACTEQNRWGVTGDANTVGNVTSSMTLYAKWVAQANGGDNVAVTYNTLTPNGVATVKHYAVGSQIALENPSVTGYTFDGWYTDADCTVRFNEDGAYTVWQEHTALYCKWTAETYTIEYRYFEVEGETLVPGEVVADSLLNGNPKTFSAGETVTLKDPKLPDTKRFIAWHTGLKTTISEITLLSFGGENTLTVYLNIADNTFPVYFYKNYNGEDYNTYGNVEHILYGNKITEKVLTDEETYREEQVSGVNHVYRFDGWYTARSGGEKFDFNTGITQSTYIYAHWAEVYRVDFNDAFTATNKTVYVDTGAAIPAEEIPQLSRENFTLVWQWNGSPWNMSEPVTEHMALEAVWTEVINNVTVAFLLDEGGETLASVVLPAGAPIGNNKPADPTRDGFRFLGWFVGETEYTEFDANVEESLTLTAKWVQVFNVTFMWNYDGTEADDVIAELTQTVDMNDFAVRQSAPTRADDPNAEKFTFNGWFTDRAGTKQFDFETTKITADVDLYAKWTAVAQGVVLEITVDGEEAKTMSMLDNTANMGADETVTYDKNFAFFGDNLVALKVGTLLKFKVDGEYVKFVFNKDSKGAKAYGSNNDTIQITVGGDFQMYLKRYRTDLPSTPSQPWEIYISGGAVIDDGRVAVEAGKAYMVGQFEGDAAFVSDKGYLMTYDADGNYGNGQWLITRELKVGEIIKFCCGSVWAGYDQIEGKAEVKANFVDLGGTEHNIKVNVAGSYKFFFKPTNAYNKIWIELDTIDPTPTTYTVTFDAVTNGGAWSDGSEKHTQEVESGKTATALEDKPIKADHTFDGWYTDPVGGDVPFDFSTPITEAITLYARYKQNVIVDPGPDEYIVTLDANGGKLSGGDIWQTTGGKLLPMPNDPTRELHSFVGWFDSKTGGNQVNSDTTFDANATIYARWEAFEDGLYVNGTTKVAAWTKNGANEVMAVKLELNADDKINVIYGGEVKAYKQNTYSTDKVTFENGAYTVNTAFIFDFYYKISGDEENVLYVGSKYVKINANNGQYLYMTVSDKDSMGRDLGFDVNIYAWATGTNGSWPGVALNNNGATTLISGALSSLNIIVNRQDNNSTQTGTYSKPTTGSWVNGGVYRAVILYNDNVSYNGGLSEIEKV